MGLDYRLLAVEATQPELTRLPNTQDQASTGKVQEEGEPSAARLRDYLCSIGEISADLDHPDRGGVHDHVDVLRDARPGPHDVPRRRDALPAR